MQMRRPRCKHGPATIGIVNILKECRQDGRLYDPLLLFRQMSHSESAVYITLTTTMNLNMSRARVKSSISARKISIAQKDHCANVHEIT